MRTKDGAASPLLLADRAPAYLTLPSLLIADAERLVLSLIEDSKECEANLAYVRSVYPMQKSNSISFLSKRVRV